MRVSMMTALAVMLFTACRTAKTAEMVADYRSTVHDSLRLEENVEVVLDEWYFYHDALPQPLPQMVGINCEMEQKSRHDARAPQAAVIRHVSMKRSGSAEAAVVAEKTMREEVAEKTEPRTGQLCRVALVAIVIAAVVAMILIKRKF